MLKREGGVRALSFLEFLRDWLKTSKAREWWWSASVAYPPAATVQCGALCASTAISRALIPPFYGVARSFRPL